MFLFARTESASIFFPLSSTVRIVECNDDNNKKKERKQQQQVVQ